MRPINGAAEITSGTTDRTFSPYQTCTTAQILIFLWRAAGSPAADGAAFTDVPAGTDQAQAAAWALSKCVTNGTTAATFAPDDTCTRAQIVTFLYRAMQ